MYFFNIKLENQTCSWEASPEKSCNEPFIVALIISINWSWCIAGWRSLLLLQHNFAHKQTTAGPSKQACSVRRSLSMYIDDLMEVGPSISWSLLSVRSSGTELIRNWNCAEFNFAASGTRGVVQFQPFTVQVHLRSLLKKTGGLMVIANFLYLVLYSN